jgi:glutamate-1-semialdehyde 2,1-aminomutase
MLTKDEMAILEDISENGLSVSKRPFLESARRLGIPEATLVNRINGLKVRGVIKDLRGVLDHKKAGYTANALVAWRAGSEASRGALIKTLVASKMVSHCYEREPDKGFDYDIFTMIHAKEKASIEKFVKTVASEFGARHETLFTEKELKREKMDLKAHNAAGPEPKRADLLRRANEALVGGVNSPVRNFAGVGGNALFAKKANGAYLWDVYGNKHIDYIMSWGVSILGHAWKGSVDAAVKSVRNGSTYGLTSANEVKLAELIKRHFKSIDKIRFVTSGTEACMTALRLARAFTKKAKVIKFDGCYHGHFDGLLVKSGSGNLTFGIPSGEGIMASYTADTVSVPFNDIEAFRKAIAKNKGDIACVVVEPVPCNTGVILPEKDFLRSLRDITKREGIVLIFDEVITGFRLAPGGAGELFGITPDLTTLGKIIGGGFPAAAVGGRRDIMKLLAPEGPVYQAGTLAANPVSIAAGISVLEELETDSSIYKDLADKAERLTKWIRSSAANHGIALRVNTIGSVFTVFFTDKQVDDQAGACRADKDTYSSFFKALLGKGVLFPPSPYEACFISRAHGRAELEKTKLAVDAALSVMEKNR